MPRVQVSPGYACPLCPDHEDEVFYSNSLLDVPLCQGCDAELQHFVRKSFERLPRYKQRWGGEIARLAGRNWDECRSVILREHLASTERLLEARSGQWLDAMTGAPGWSLDQCLIHLEAEATEIRAAIAEASGGTEPGAGEDDPQQALRGA